MSADPPRRIPRVLACLVKGPLGCLAFVAGAAVVLVLLLPPAGGRLAGRVVEDWFEEHHEGSVELGDAWIGSFYGPQRVESLILRDPNGDEVLRAQVRAPSFGELLDENHSPYGPVLVQVTACRVTTTADGETNLLAALEEKDSDEDERRQGLRVDRPLEVTLEIVVERLHWRDARGNQGVLDGLVLRGSLVVGPDGARLTLAGGSDPAAPEPVHARIEATRPAFGPSTWSPAVEIEGLPGALAGLLIEGLEPLGGFAGPRLDDVRWERDGKRYGLRATDEGASFELSGTVDDGAVGGPDGAALLTLPCADPRGDALLALLLPVLGGIECDTDDARAAAVHSLRLDNGEWPLDGDWDDLTGDLQLELAPSRARIAAPLAGLFASGEAPSPDGSAPSLVLEHFARTVHVEDGVLELALFRLPLADGWLQLDGTVELPGRTADLTVTGERAGASFDLGRLTGPSGALAPAPPEPPDVPEVIGEEPAPGDG